ncbi:hypothetical protein FOA52_001227 [Chlamydomonas sp. UWO 241]|nr:hypothetical protein FOA52_001227 [Chlamydomonas sp. UWO 241]
MTRSALRQLVRKLGGTVREKLRAVETLEDLCDNGNPETRAAIVAAGAIPALVKLLGPRSSADVQERAAGALWSLTEDDEHAVLYRSDFGREEDWLYLEQDLDYIVAVAASAAQVWSAGLHRVRLSQVVRSEADLESEGVNISAYWCPDKSTLAVLTSSNIMHIYVTYMLEETLLPTSATPQTLVQEVHKVDLYLRSTVQLELESRAVALSGDGGKAILLGCENGSVAALGWSGKVRGVSSLVNAREASPFPSRGTSRSTSVLSHTAAADQYAAQQQRRNSANESAGGGAGGAGVPGLSPFMGAGACPPIAGMHYCENSRCLALVLADGSAALCSGASSDSGNDPLDGLVLSHWLVVPPERHATCARVGWIAQMVAVGCSNGEVALYRLHRLRSATSASLSEYHVGPDGSMYGSGGGARGGGASGRGEPPVRVLSLEPWGHRFDSTGGVSVLEWSPDGRALAVGHVRRGLSVWSPSGCRLMCSLPQPRGDAAATQLSQQLSSASSMGWGAFAAGGAGAGSAAAARPLETPVVALAWGALGYQLLVATAGCAGSLVELSFARSLPNHHRVAHAGTAVGGGGPAEELHVMQAHDRLLIIGEALTGGPSSALSSSYAAPVGSGDRHNGRRGSDVDGGGGNLPGGGGADEAPTANNLLTISHVPLPLSYLTPNWPLVRAAVSPNGMDVAVAAQRGLALYSRASNRWRLFGDVSQERQVSCQALAWLRSVVVCCSGPTPPSDAAVPSQRASAGGACELLLFPRYHLDMASCLVRHPLPRAPVAMDCVGSHILLASDPLEIAMFEVTITGQLQPRGNPKATLQLVREISMLDVGKPLLNMALVVPTGRATTGPWGSAGGCGRGHGGAGDGLGAGGRGGAGAGGPSVDASGSSSAALPVPPPVPRQAVLLRCGGLLSVLDLERGSEMTLSSEVECFWLSDNLPSGAQQRSSNAGGGSGQGTFSAASGGSSAARGGAAGALEFQLGIAGSTPLDTESVDVEMPWWGYGPAGMQLWFPSSLSTPLTPQAGLSGSGINLDIELEFDQEVYPIGISLADASIVGVTQRVTRSAGYHSAPAAPSGAGDSSGTGPGAAASSLPCLHPVPESQPVLPCLLRRLLAKGALHEATALARRHEPGPHFMRSLEWLLFTTLELESSNSHKNRGHQAVAAKPRPSTDARGQAVLGRTPPGDSYLNRPPEWQSSSGCASSLLSRQVSPLLTNAAALVRQFPQYADVVVSVARKTDAQLWPPLFSAVGPPSELLEGLLQAGALASAACFLLVIDRLEGASVAHTQAIRLIQLALLRGEYALVGDLLRFILPPGEVLLERAASSVAAEGGGADVAARDAPRGDADGAGSTDQQPQQQSWIGWLFGWPAGAPGAPPPAAAAARADPAGGAPPPPLPAYAALLGGGDLAPATGARTAIAEHAWGLLGSGQLAGLARLQQAVAFLPDGGLCTLLREAGYGTPTPASGDGDGTSGGPASGARDPAAAARVSARELVSALSVVARELPVWGSKAVEDDASDLAACLRPLGLPHWSAALAVVLVDDEYVGRFRDAQPQLWAEFKALVLGDPSFAYIYSLLQLLEPEAAGDGGQGGEPAAVVG